MEGDKKVAVRPGFERASKRGSLALPQFARFKKDKIPLAPSSSLDHEILTFSYKTTEPELIRIPANPIAIAYVVKEGKQPADGAKTENTRAKTNAASGKGRVAYFNTSIGASTFFSESWVVCDQNDLQAQFSNESKFLPWYSYFQKVFTTAEERRRSWNVDHIVTDEGMLDDDPPDPQYLAALDTCEFSVREGHAQKTMLTSFEGTPFLCNPRNKQLCDLLGLDHARQNYFVLPAGHEIVIKFRRQSPHHRFIEQRHVTAATSDRKADGTAADTFTGVPVDLSKLFSDGDLTQTPHPYLLEIKDMQIEIETMTLDTNLGDHRELLRRLERQVVGRHVDLPLVSVSELSAGMVETSVAFDIPAGCVLAYLAFVWENNAFFTEASKHWSTVHCEWPENCIGIRFFLGHEEILFSGGLKKLGVADTVDRERLKRYLMDRNWHDYDNPDYFAGAGENSFRSGIIPLDLSAYDHDKIRNLRVELTFGENKSPKNMLVMLARVQTHTLESNWKIAPAASLVQSRKRTASSPSSSKKKKK